MKDAISNYNYKNVFFRFVPKQFLFLVEEYDKEVIYPKKDEG